MSAYVNPPGCILSLFPCISIFCSMPVTTSQTSFSSSWLCSADYWETQSRKLIRQGAGHRSSSRHSPGNCVGFELWRFVCAGAAPRSGLQPNALALVAGLLGLLAQTALVGSGDLDSHRRLDNPGTVRSRFCSGPFVHIGEVVRLRAPSCSVETSDIK